MPKKDYSAAEMHKAIMDKVWSLYAQTSAEADWIAMPEHIEKIHDDINELVVEALGLKERAD